MVSRVEVPDRDGTRKCPATAAPPRFSSLDGATAEEVHGFIAERELLRNALVDRLVEELRNLRGNALGYPVDRYDHCLQTATRALRDGASEPMVAAALLHDIGDRLAPDNHAEIAAAILKPFVPLNVHWVVQHHDLFQIYHFGEHLDLDHNAREGLKEHRFYQDALRFADQWDQVSFDPDYQSLGLEDLLPVLRRVVHG